MFDVEKKSFDYICNVYRVMMKANEIKSFEERRKAINDFRCGKL